MAVMESFFTSSFFGSHHHSCQLEDRQVEDKLELDTLVQGRLAVRRFHRLARPDRLVVEVEDRLVVEVEDKLVLAGRQELDRVLVHRT